MWAALISATGFIVSGSFIAVVAVYTTRNARRISAQAVAREAAAQDRSSSAAEFVLLKDELWKSIHDLNGRLDRMGTEVRNLRSLLRSLMRQRRIQPPLSDDELASIAWDNSD